MVGEIFFSSISLSATHGRWLKVWSNVGNHFKDYDFQNKGLAESVSPILDKIKKIEPTNQKQYLQQLEGKIDQKVAVCWINFIRFN